MTREEMWEEFESQLKSEVRTPITMSYDESIRIAEMGIKDVVKKWKKRLDQEPKTGHWKAHGRGYEKIYVCDNCKKESLQRGNYCPNCGAKMESEDK